MVALFALVLAMPVALGIAIFLAQYSPRRVTGPLAYMVDLLAAVPSIIYGVWGLYVLAPRLRPVATWLNEHLGGMFLFATGNASVSGGGTIFIARDRAGGDDSADHHRSHPRGLHEDAAGPHRSRAGARRHPLGGGQDRSAAVRAVRIHQRRDAGPGPRARGDRRIAGHPARDAVGVRLVAVRRWLHLRHQDRGNRIRIQQPVQGRRLHRCGPDAVPAHACGECHCPSSCFGQGQPDDVDTGPPPQGANVHRRQRGAAASPTPLPPCW